MSRANFHSARTRPIYVNATYVKTCGCNKDKTFVEIARER
jgi:hypothetical protein